MANPSVTHPHPLWAHPLHPCISQIQHPDAWFGKSECCRPHPLWAHPLHPCISQIQHPDAWFGKSECCCPHPLQVHPLHPWIGQTKHLHAWFGKSECPCHPLHPCIFQIKHIGAWFGKFECCCHRRAGEGTFRQGCLGGGGIQWEPEATYGVNCILEVGSLGGSFPAVRATAVGRDAEWNAEWDAVLAGDPKRIRLLCNTNLITNIPSRGSKEERIRIHLQVRPNIQNNRYKR